MLFNERLTSKKACASRHPEVLAMCLAPAEHWQMWSGPPPDPSLTRHLAASDSFVHSQRNASRRRDSILIACCGRVNAVLKLHRNGNGVQSAINALDMYLRLDRTGLTSFSDCMLQLFCGFALQFIRSFLIRLRTYVTLNYAARFLSARGICLCTLIIKCVAMFHCFVRTCTGSDRTSTLWSTYQTNTVW